jgi:hypothetical protein
MTLRTSECHGDNELVLYVEPAHQARYIRCIFELLNASSHAVKYEAATTLTTLTQNPAAVKGGFFVAYGPSGRC